MMKKLRWIAGFGTIALLTIGCSSNATKTQAPTPEKQVASQPKPSPAPVKSPELLPVPPDLLPPVNVPERVSQTVGSQDDPFSQTPVLPAKETALPAEPAQPKKNVASQPKRVSPKTQAQASAKKSPQVETTQSTQNTNTTTSNPSAPGKTSVKPAPPSTDLANAVVVSGIVQVQGRVSAIVIAPNEPTTRTVGVGDSLSGGQVRVKQIVLQGDPVVILEQNGVQVTKPVSGSVATAS
jgi:uncharacterized membrane protein